MEVEQALLNLTLISTNIHSTGKHNNVQCKSSKTLPSIYTYITLRPAIQWSLDDVGEW